MEDVGDRPEDAGEDSAPLPDDEDARTPPDDVGGDASPPESDSVDDSDVVPDPDAVPDPDVVTEPDTQVFSDCFPDEERACHGTEPVNAVPEPFRGVERCGQDGRWSGICNGWSPLDDPPEPECTAGATETCYGGSEPLSLVQPCNLGSRICGANGFWGACTGWTRPQDNPCDAPSCEGVTWTRAHLPNTRDIQGEYREALATIFQANGLQVTRSSFVGFDQLANTDVAVLSASVSSPALDERPSEVRQWIEEGGVLVVHGNTLGMDCRVANAFLARTGVAFQLCDTAMARGPVADFPTHPLTSGLQNRAWPHDSGNRLRLVGSSAQAIVRNQSGDILAAVERIGCGALVVLSAPDLVRISTDQEWRPVWNAILSWATQR